MAYQVPYSLPSWHSKYYIMKMSTTTAQFTNKAAQMSVN